MRAIMLGFALIAALPGAAGAVPATADEAARLAALFQGYLPATERSAVTVTPRGESYALALDLGRALAPVAQAGVSLTAGDLAATLTPQADGRWAVRVDGLPPLGIVQNGQATSWSIDGYTADGVFDPALRAFATLASTNHGSTSHVTSGQGTVIDAKLTGTAIGSSTAVPAGEGLATVTARSEAKALAYGIVSSPAAGATAPAPLQAEAKIGSLSSDLAWERMPTVALDGLWRFLAAHPSRAALTASQAEFKERLRAVVPAAGPMSGSATLDGLSVVTRLGTFGLDCFKERFAVAAAGATGIAPSFSLSLAGLRLPSDLVPPAMAPLVPSGLDLALSYGPVDLATPALGAIDALDLAASPPIDDARGRTLLAWTNVGTASVKLGPSTLTTPTMTLKLQGESRFGTTTPTGSLSVSAVGLDRTIAAMQAAGSNDPMGKQAVTMLLAAKAFARAEGPDSYAWQIESLPGGAVTVNGTALADLAPPPSKPPAKAPNKRL